MRPILLPPNSTNQRALSGPAVIQNGLLPGNGVGNSEITPAGVIRPIPLTALFPNSVNQRMPSEPVTIPLGAVLLVKIVDSVTTPAVVILPILWGVFSVNQSAPSGPEVIPTHWLVGVGNGYFVHAPAGV